MFGGLPRKGISHRLHQEHEQHIISLVGEAVNVVSRKGYETLKRYQPILNDRLFILSRNPNYVASHGTVVKSFSAVAEEIRKRPDWQTRSVNLLGGGRVFADNLWRCDKVYMSIFQRYYKYEARFPLGGLDKFQIIAGRQSADQLVWFLTYHRQSV